MQYLEDCCHREEMSNLGPSGFGSYIAAPDVGDRPLVTGVTVKVTLLLATPPTLTTTGPDVAFAGTAATITPVFQLVGVALIPLNVSVLDPWLDPKFAPLMVTDAPTTPLVGEILLIEGDLPPIAPPTRSNPAISVAVMRSAASRTRRWRACRARRPKIHLHRTRVRANGTNSSARSSPAQPQFDS